LCPALRAFHHAPRALKDLTQGFDLTLADSGLALRPQVPGFFAEFNDVGHFAPHFFAVKV
jgi:hypothetical protein